MTPDTYNALTRILALAVYLAIALAAVSLVAIVVRWRTEKRRGHVIRLFAFLAAVPCLVAAQQAILWFVFLPSLGNAQLEEINDRRAASLAETSFVHVGDASPEFVLQDADGAEFSIRQSAGRVVLINFFATWCGPCRMELPHVERIWRKYRDNDNFRLLVVGREESMESVQEFRKKNGFSFPIAPDPQRAVYSLFAAQSIPRTIVISPSGTVVYSKAGFHQSDLDELEDVLANQLAAVP